MHPDLENRLAELPKQGDVFVYRQTNLGSDEWKVYQKRELKYWQDHYDSGHYPDYKDSFSRVLSRFDIDADYFSKKKLLEIGCGPQGFSASLVQLAEKQPETHIIVDPLLDKYQRFSTFSLFGKETIKIAALGEDIPVPSDFFDIVVCQNVLDHVYEPSIVVDEIYRTLKKDGVALISVHTFSPFFRIFRPVVKRLDRNHPHHFTNKHVLSLFSKFVIISNSSHILNQDNPALKKDSAKSLKLFLATRYLKTTYLVARKV